MGLALRFRGPCGAWHKAGVQKYLFVHSFISAVMIHSEYALSLYYVPGTAGHKTKLLLLRGTHSLWGGGDRQHTNVSGDENCHEEQ